MFSLNLVLRNPALWSHLVCVCRRSVTSVNVGLFGKQSSYIFHFILFYRTHAACLHINTTFLDLVFLPKLGFKFYKTIVQNSCYIKNNHKIHNAAGFTYTNSNVSVFFTTTTYILSCIKTANII